METSTFRISNVEFTKTGQASQVGRSSITVHQIDDLHDSYLRGCSIHHTFNRAVGLHRVNYLRVQENIIYNVRGHAILLGTGAETKNRIECNCIVDMRAQSAILSSDFFPAGIFVQNPDNEVTGNSVAESDAYGIWYHLPEHPELRGTTLDAGICPRHVTLNKFEGNIAHTNQKDGLVIWPIYDPRAEACTVGTDDWVVAEFRDFMGYNNGEHGAMAFEVGAVQFVDFKMANNMLVNVEYSKIVSSLPDDYAKIVGGWMLGKSPGLMSCLPSLIDAAPNGIVFARDEYFRVINTKFCYYLWAEEAACLSPCSNCDDDVDNDIGAYTTIITNLWYDPATVDHRIRFHPWQTSIIYDTDSTTTDHADGI